MSTYVLSCQIQFLRRKEEGRLPPRRKQRGFGRLIHMSHSESAYRITMKFGGTSVGSAEAIRRVASIVQQTRRNVLHTTANTNSRQTALVVSAMSGVTNELIRAAESAVNGDLGSVESTMQILQERHLATVAALGLAENESLQLEDEIAKLLGYGHSLCQATSVLGELTPRGSDVISGLGERLSVHLVAAALRSQGLAAQAIEATELIITDDNFGAASPLPDETRARIRARVLPMLREDTIPVVTGFVGATRDGRPTTLGRGGSDYTATILGADLDSDEIWIWSDVDGVMTADPRIVPDAQTIDVLSCAEAAEFSYFGAKVIHPKTILPAVEHRIPLRILNSFDPSHPGTLILAETRPNGRVVKGITAVKHVSQVTVEGRGMIGIPGIAARVFTAVAQEHVNVLMISQSSSEQSICFIVPQGASERTLWALKRAFESDMLRHNVERIWSQDDVAIVAVVGEQMKGTVGIAGRLFSALAEQEINILAIAQGSSEYNISMALSAGDADRAVRALHATFELGQKSHGRL